MLPLLMLRDLNTNSRLLIRQAAICIHSTSTPYCYHHRLDTLGPGLHPAARHRSIMGLVAINCNTMLCQRDVVWLYPPLEDAMAEVGLQEVGTYASL